MQCLQWPRLASWRGRVNPRKAFGFLTRFTRLTDPRVWFVQKKLSQKKSKAKKKKSQFFERERRQRESDLRRHERPGRSRRSSYRTIQQECCTRGARRMMDRKCLTVVSPSGEQDQKLPNTQDAQQQQHTTQQTNKQTSSEGGAITGIAVNRISFISFVERKFLWCTAHAICQ